MSFRGVEHLDVLVDVGNVNDFFGVLLRLNHRAEIVRHHCQRIAGVVFWLRVRAGGRRVRALRRLGGTVLAATGEKSPAATARKKLAFMFLI